MRDSESYQLWIEEIPSRLRFDYVSGRILGSDRYSSYLFILLIVFIDVPILSTITYIIHDGQTVHPLIDYGWWILVPIALMIGVFAMKRIRSKYSDAINNVGKDSGNLEIKSPNRFRIGVYVLSMLVYLPFIAQNLTQFLASEGQIIGSIKWLIIIPFFYLPIISEFFVIYIHGLFFLPFSIFQQNIDLDFSDPNKLGGMGKVGDSMIFATSFYFIGLALWTGTTIIGPITGIKATESGPDSFSIGFFMIAWFVGLLLFFLSLWIIHKHMYTKKQEKIDELMEEIRKSGQDEEVFPYVNPQERDENIEYMQKYINLNRVEETKTYPVDINKIWEFSASAFLPIFLQFSSMYLL